jgi:hypothetical protein
VYSAQRDTLASYLQSKRGSLAWIESGSLFTISLAFAISALSLPILYIGWNSAYFTQICGPYTVNSVVTGQVCQEWEYMVTKVNDNDVVNPIRQAGYAFQVLSVMVIGFVLVCMTRVMADTKSRTRIVGITLVSMMVASLIFQTIALGLVGGVIESISVEDVPVRKTMREMTAHGLAFPMTIFSLMSLVAACFVLIYCRSEVKQLGWMLETPSKQAKPGV